MSTEATATPPPSKSPSGGMMPQLRKSSEGNNIRENSNNCSRTPTRRPHSTTGLYVTLPNNFNLSSSNGSGSNNGGGGMMGSPRGSTGGGSSPTPPLNGANNKLRASPTTPLHHHHHHHSWEDLRRLFLVSLEKLSRLEPESLPFRQPVDPEALGIPDYFDIIRRPMDLQTIRLKMNSGKYNEPFLYVDDVLRMLDNAWVYNREGSKVYNYATRLAEVFMAEVNPILGHLGYRQGRSNGFQFNSDVVICYGRPVCMVFKGEGYWRGSADGLLEFNLCDKCYKAMMMEEGLEYNEGNNGSSPNSTATSTSSSSATTTPDLIPQQHSSSSCSSNNSNSQSSSPQKSNFVYTINNSKVYSPAAELHRSHLRDAEMSRQLVLREFLRMLMEDKSCSNQNVWKMLKSNPKLTGEFLEYIKRRKGTLCGVSGGYYYDGDNKCSSGEFYGTQRIDDLIKTLEGLRIADNNRKSSSSEVIQEASTQAESEVDHHEKLIVTEKKQENREEEEEEKDNHHQEEQ